MEATQQTYQGQASSESIWAILREVAELQRETARRQEETDRIVKDTALRQEETDRIIRETVETQEEVAEAQKENARQINDLKKRQEENARQIGKLGGRFGEMIEYMVMPNLLGKFRDLGFVFTKGHHQTVIKDEQYKIIAEVDITLENGDKVMIVEVKSKPSIEDIKDHIERMGKLRLYAGLHGDSRKYLGAVAGMMVNDNERDYALKNGFYVIEPSGETFTITAPEGFLREW